MSWLATCHNRFLSYRKKYESEAWSERLLMPGSLSQGCYLAMILFIVQFNGAALRPPVPRPLQQDNGVQQPFQFQTNRLQVKFVDDQSIAAAYNLSKVLKEEEGR